MILQLRAANCKKLDSIHRISFLWASMTWMKSMESACVFTKRNISISTIGIIFIIARSDVHHPRHTTSEPWYRVFVNVRRHKREATVQEFVEIVEKLELEWATICERSYVQGTSSEKWYGSICKDFLLSTIDCSASPETEGMIDVDHASSEAAMIQL